MPKKNSTSEHKARQFKLLGEEIRKQRAATAWTQTELSNEFGFKYNIIIKWESGQKPHPNESNINELADKFNINPEIFWRYIDFELPNEPIEKEYTKKYVPEVGERLGRLLEERGMSGREFAKELGQYQQHVSKYITGDAEPKIFYLKKMVDFFFPTMPMEGMAYFLYGTPVPNIPYKATIDKQRKTIEDLKARLAECEERMMA